MSSYSTLQFAYNDYQSIRSIAQISIHILSLYRVLSRVSIE